MKGYALQVQSLFGCTLLKKGRVNYKIQFSNGDIKYIKPEKFTYEDEEICVVWMMNKGVEGSYRIERELYSSKRRLAKNYPFQALVWEDSYGIENQFNDHRLI